MIAAAVSCSGGGGSSSDEAADTATSARSSSEIGSSAPATTTTTTMTSSTGSTPGSPKDDGLSACSLVTAAQLHDATGRTFTVADQQSPRVQTCYFDDGDGINLDFVSILHTGADVKSFDGEVDSYAGAGTGTGEAVTDLPGIGQEAKTFEGAYTFVLAGQYVIGIGLDFSHDAPAGDKIETARTIARIVASNVN